MLLLAVDTAVDISAIAVVRESGSLVNLDTQVRNRHVEVLVPRIEQTLSIAEVALSDIGTFVVGIGPGSWTGLRVGIITLRGFAHAMHKPLYAVSSLEVMAFPYLRAGRAVSAFLPARRDGVYIGTYQQLEDGNVGCLEQPRLIGAAELVDTSDSILGVVGDWNRIPNGERLAVQLRERGIMPFHQPGPTAVALGALAAAIVTVREAPALDDIKPLYVLPPNTTMPRARDADMPSTKR